MTAPPKISGISNAGKEACLFAELESIVDYHFAGSALCGWVEQGGVCRSAHHCQSATPREVHTRVAISVRSCLS